MTCLLFILQGKSYWTLSNGHEWSSMVVNVNKQYHSLTWWRKPGLCPHASAFHPRPVPVCRGCWTGEGLGSTLYRSQSDWELWGNPPCKQHNASQIIQHHSGGCNKDTEQWWRRQLIKTLQNCQSTTCVQLL